MNDVELSVILFYADYLSLQADCKPVTDNCKYFFIHEAPINSAFIIGLEPVYDPENEHFKRAVEEYNYLKDKFGNNGVLGFIDNIAYIRASGCVDAIRMLQCIYQFSTKQLRNTAFQKYSRWKKSLKYTHILEDEDGRDIEEECTKYVFHHERLLEKRNLLSRIRKTKKSTASNT